MGPENISGMEIEKQMEMQILRVCGLCDGTVLNGGYRSIQAYGPSSRSMLIMSVAH